VNLNHAGLVGFLGGGMWKVLPGCPAKKHNTLSASKGKLNVPGRKTVSGNPKCVCPRALALKEDEKNRRTAAAAASRGGTSGRLNRAAGSRRQAYREGSGRATYVANMRQGAPPPELRDASCRTPGGRKIIEATEGHSRHSTQALAAKRLCDMCPERAACLGWAMRDEIPAGSWGLVYGGLLPGERIDLKAGAL
jgi:hypothetical protein